MTWAVITWEAHCTMGAPPNGLSYCKSDISGQMGHPVPVHMGNEDQDTVGVSGELSDQHPR